MDSTYDAADYISIKYYEKLQADNAALRQRLARLVEAAKHYIITPDADEITKRIALHDLRVCLSGVEDEDNG